MEKQKNLFSRDKGRIIFWILILLFFSVFALKFADLKELFTSIKQSNLFFIFLAVFAQFFYFVAFTFTYKIAFRLVNIKRTFKRLFPLTFAYIFVNVVAPTGGASGAALFATDASKRKESPIRTLAGVLIANVAQFFTFGVILCFGVFYLYSTRDLQAYQIIATGLMTSLTLFLITIFILGIYKPSYLHKYLNWQTKLLNFFTKLLRLKKRFKDDWIEEGVIEFSNASQNITKQTKEIGKLISCYFIVHAINILSLLFVFLAFNESVSLWTLVSGFVMGVVFQIVGITPYGIGLTESAMTLTFTSQGIPAEIAILITLTYRGITFWLPLLIGFILLRKVHIFGLGDISIVRIFKENKHITNIKNAIKVQFIDIEK